MSAQIKSLFVNVLMIFAVLLMVNVSCINSANASTSVWKVSKGEHYFYLGGTIHVLSAQDHPLPKPFFVAYADANRVIFETDLDAISSPAYQSKIMSTMSNPGNLTLVKQLDRKVYNELKAFIISRGLTPAQFSAFQPWAASLMLTMMEYQRLGMLPEYGVDAHFNKLALDDKKERASLETPEVQLAVLSSMSSIEPNEFIEYTLEDLERLPDLINGMKIAWRTGNIDSLAEHAMIEKMKSDFPSIYKTLLTDRNKHWMKQLVLFNNNPNIEFVLVGALHLYGDDGLLALLKAQGFNLELL